MEKKTVGRKVSDMDLAWRHQLMKEERLGGRGRLELLSKISVKVTDRAVRFGKQGQRKTLEREGIDRHKSLSEEDDLWGVRVVQRGFSESWCVMRLPLLNVSFR